MLFRDKSNIGVGQELGYDKFEDYLKDIPTIPDGLTKDPGFPILVLEDPRISLRKLCELVGITMLIPEEKFVDLDLINTPAKMPRWIAIHDGHTNKNFSVIEVHKVLGHGRTGLTALQGVYAFIQNTLMLVITDYPELCCRGINLSETCVMEGREEVPGRASALLDISIGGAVTLVGLGRADNYSNNRSHGTPIRKIV